MVKNISIIIKILRLIEGKFLILSEDNGKIMVEISEVKNKTYI